MNVRAQVAVITQEHQEASQGCPGDAHLTRKKTIGGANERFVDLAV